MGKMEGLRFHLLPPSPRFLRHNKQQFHAVSLASRAVASFADCLQISSTFCAYSRVFRPSRAPSVIALAGSCLHLSKK
jgi:hypothetical protein